VEALKSENTKLKIQQLTTNSAPSISPPSISPSWISQQLAKTNPFPSSPSISPLVQTLMPAKTVIEDIGRHISPEFSILKNVSHPTTSTSTRKVPLPLLRLPLPLAPEQPKCSTPLVPVSLEKVRKESVLASSATMESAVLLPQQSELRVILTLSLLMAFFQVQGAILRFQAMFLSLWTLNSVLTQTPQTSLLRIPSWNGISKRTQFKTHQIVSPNHPQHPCSQIPKNFHLLLILCQT